MEPFKKFFDFDGDGKLNTIEVMLLLDTIERIEEETEDFDDYLEDWVDEEDDWEDIDSDDLDIDEL